MKSIFFTSGMASGGDRLRVVTVVDLKHKMDALVSDLTHALDESQLPQYHRKRRGFKRRVKLPNSLIFLSTVLSNNRALSEDSSSSIGEVLLSQDNKSSIPLTDSDDMSPPPEPRLRTQLLTHHRAPSTLVESDSVNENFSPMRPHNRRKRKCKRLALDPDAPSTSNPQGTSVLPAGISSILPITKSSSFCGVSLNRRKKALRSSPDTENRYLAVSAGKRKRGRERSVEWCGQQLAGKRHGTSSHFHSLRAHHTSQASTVDSMEYEYSDEDDMDHSNDSSESEAGIYTCDEGREADDEQSDWFAEPDPVYGVPGSNNQIRQRNFSNRLSWWNDNDLGLSSSAKRREIRAGRRRIRDRKPGYSIVSSVNDKVSRFLQDPTQSELRLRPMTDKDLDQLNHLANLYSLTVRSGDDQTAPILTKTRNTITKQRLEVEGETLACGGSFPGGLPVPLSDLKRRKRTPPPSNNLTEGSNDSVESVFNSAGTSFRPPLPTVSWEDDIGDCCADSLSERLADSEPDPLPSPTSLGLHDCTL
ncbi:G patch domain-containing protein 2-like isoform X5 [Palaemon carinicauda]|uniref:G patch domain-containing protein 2-like isoform X5 n=1 Tax=Palaemon carinicauda TaxID=392227 RepID=UPI0035B69475